MAFNPSNPVSGNVGLSTQKDHYDILFENASTVRAGLLNLSQAPNEIPVAASPSALTFDPGLRLEGGDTLRVDEVEVVSNAPATPVVGRIYKNTIIKAWCVINPWVVGGDISITASFNVHVVPGTPTAGTHIPVATNGHLVLVFQEPLADENYACFVDVHNNSLAAPPNDGDTADDYASAQGSRATTGATIRIFGHGGNLHNPNGEVHILVLGN